MALFVVKMKSKITALLDFLVQHDFGTLLLNKSLVLDLSSTQLTPLCPLDVLGFILLNKLIYPQQECNNINILMYVTNVFLY